LNFSLDKKLRTCGLIAATAALTACVTINIYFPAAAAEKAADKVIDEIWQTPAGQSPASEPKPASPSGDQSSQQESTP
jgi:hypothetical protein